MTTLGCVHDDVAIYDSHNLSFLELMHINLNLKKNKDDSTIIGFLVDYWCDFTNNIGHFCGWIAFNRLIMYDSNDII